MVGKYIEIMHHRSKKFKGSFNGLIEVFGNFSKICLKFLSAQTKSIFLIERDFTKQTSKELKDPKSSKDVWSPVYSISAILAYITEIERTNDMQNNYTVKKYMSL